MSILRILFGISLLTLGRKLYWVFVAAIGFEAGFRIATQLFHGSPEVAILLIALVVGILGAVVAVFLRSVAIGIGGFLAGGYLLALLADILLPGPGVLGLVAFIIGGIIGSILLYALFDWALIALSSAAGAAMIVQGLGLAPTASAVAAIVLFGVGIAIQAITLQSEKR